MLIQQRSQLLSHDILLVEKGQQGISGVETTNNQMTRALTMSRSEYS